MTHKSVVIGTGSCLPERRLTNTDLENMVDTSDEWITTRTGIKSRHIAGINEATSKLACGAARKAISMAGVNPGDIDQIIVATMTPDMTMPSCACLVQKELEAVNAFALDVNAACSGFIYSLDIADKYIRCNPAMKVLVIGAETLSTRTNWKDRNTCVLFGDGAGACLLAGSNKGDGMLGSRLYSDGSLWGLLSMEGAPSMNPDLLRSGSLKGSYIQMVGKDVFRYAVRAMEVAVLELLDAEGLAMDDVKLLIPHQANIRILNSLSERLKIPKEKIYININKHGNTSAASIPIAIDEANQEGFLEKDDLLLLCAFGGGFTWGASIIRW